MDAKGAFDKVPFQKSKCGSLAHGAAHGGVDSYGACHALFLHVDGLAKGAVHGGLLHSLTQGGVAMAGTRNVFCARAILQCYAHLMDKLASGGAHDVAAQDLIGLSIGNKLDHSLSLIHRSRAAVAHERELASLVCQALLLGVLLSHAQASHLRVGVADAGHRVIVDVAFLACQDFCSSHTVLLSLMREHRPWDAISDGVDGGHSGAEVAVHLDLVALRHLHAQLLQAQALGVWTPPDGHQHHVCLHCLCLAPLGCLHLQLDLFAHNLAT
mmetsp:Transcript_27295/g.73769  ORF Transcript_27295/g.73769 Transcript_27295/m.73769 type:complete len:270 (-) Transcript_27295:832-1641(-)